MATDFLVAGGGVIGLSLAYELAGRGYAVQLVDAPRTAKQASWTAAGILPPPLGGVGADPTEQLRVMAHALHPRWSVDLKSQTDIDNGFRRCGGLYVARSPGEAASLLATMQDYRASGATVERLGLSELIDMEPRVNRDWRQPPVAFRLPAEYQLRCPWHLRALREACALRGVSLRAGETLKQLDPCGSSVRVRTSHRTLEAGAVCLTMGAWVGEFLRASGIRTGIEPICGQMVLWRTEGPWLRHVLNEEYRYLVPREDGYLLAGATLEETGFRCETSAAGVLPLREFAESWLPDLKSVPVLRTWAGLRAGSRRGRPYLGPVPQMSGVYVATGHFRSGHHLAPATAVVMADLMTGRSPEIDLAAFKIDL